ncbi:MAG: peptidylprolyl isomerase [Bradymonadales bacterium]|jgi:FKBP-type peptidyl-prolyl cis-trans isomerase SlyD
MNKTAESLVIKNDFVVSIVYVLTNSSGELLDLSTHEKPMRYMHGHGNIIRGLEKALEGKAIGDHLEVDVAPEDAYGLRDGEPQAVPKSIFPEGTEFKIGAGMMAKSEDGKPFPLWIVKMDEENVYVDGNHPLAGQTLHFSVDVVAMRAATEDELKDGVPHDGCEACRD